MTAPLAELRVVRKRFGDRVALDGVDLQVEPGEIVALLGPNGAGKTTAIRLLLGLRRPDAGEAHLFGLDPRRPLARTRCGATPQEVDLPETLRVGEIVDFVRRHFSQPLPTPELLERFGLARLVRRQAGGLSGGERRRVAVALAFAGDPELAFLDEPSTGLDVTARRSLWEAIRSFAASGRGILLSTHDLREAEALATRVVVLDRGRVIIEGPTRTVAAFGAATVVRLRRQRLPPLRTAEFTEIGSELISIRTQDEAALLRELVALQADLDGIEIARPGLERLLDDAAEGQR